MNNESKGAGWRHSAWMFLRILNVRLRFIILMVATGIVAAQWDNIVAHWDRWTRPHRAEVSATELRVEYYCPMHPSVIRGELGNCPICGMPLVKRAKGEKPELPEGVLGRVQLTPYRMKLAGVATSEVLPRAIAGSIRTVGTIDIDERRTSHISARIGGRIETLHVDFTGDRVAKGAPLVDIYSPELVSTQKEYLLALAALEKAKTSGLASAITTAQDVFDAAHRRLKLWGINDAQLAEVEGEDAPNPHQTILAPISGIVTQKNILAGQTVMEGDDLYTIADLSEVWMNASVYEADISKVRVGQLVTIRADAAPGRTFAGKVGFIAPTMDVSTRTARVRVDVANPDFTLKPGMYVDAEIATPPVEAGGPTAARPAAPTYTCTMDPQIVSDKPGDCPICGMHLVRVVPTAAGVALSVPESAVIDTGTRKVVYLEREPGTFDAIEVEVGPPDNGFYPVLAGLTEGDRVVTKGAFLIDAENRLNPGAAGSYFGASGGPGVGGKTDANGQGR
jgi:membrane fusion protein, copper/silver efflux system